MPTLFLITFLATANAVLVQTLHENGTLIRVEVPAIRCQGPKSCNYHGDCASDKSMCLCRPSYVTVPPDASSQCNHRVQSFLKQIELQSDPPVTINCTGPSSCSYNGDCDSTKTFCWCQNEYMTFPATAFPQCNYHQYSQLTAFLLQFFLGWISGAGAWHIDRNSIGLGQVLLFWVGIIVCCILAVTCPTKDEENSLNPGIACLTTCVVLGSLIWNIVLWAWIAEGSLYDGDGAPLYNW